VAKRVAARIAFTFNTQHHAKAWKHYQVHPPMKKGEKVSAVACQARYCIPDEVHNDYVYTPAWVDFLVKKLSDPTEYQSVIGRKPTGAGPAV
jgi:hypothetical protein